MKKNISPESVCGPGLLRSQCWSDRNAAVWSLRMRMSLVLLSVVILDSSVFAGGPLEVSGRAEDVADWRDASDPSRVAEAFGRKMHVNGWLFFGSEQLSDNFGDTSHRIESLPGYVAQVAVAQGTRVARFGAYAMVPVPRAKEPLAGTLTLDAAVDQAELLTIRVGAGAPPMTRLALLVDNLGSADYVSRSISLAVDGKEGPNAATSPNGTPDWLFWDLTGLKEGSEISLRIQPDKGVATVGGLMFLSTSVDVPTKPSPPLKP